ncbi:MAG: VOC family protein [Candidatus Eisenbacteria bacterium]|uniref:VOC family protein n=1 Tax=Eiseniibacteriota bacterium TaxID=2212470 RepID=A0A956LXJ4_UNCEI|nr:VOC family protein [Candidatus Eisenbacteria bacterium]
MVDVGLTHVALPVTDAARSLEFYAKYAHMQVVHRRRSAETGHEVLWVSDRTRPFVIVLMEVETRIAPLLPSGHLGVGCRSRGEVDRLCAEAERDGCLLAKAVDAGMPVGYFALLRDPDGHTLELAHGQEVGLAVAREGAAGSNGES